MAAPDLALQKVIVAALRAGVPLVANRVYDRAPQGVAFPWIQIGDWQVIDDSVECITGVEVAVVLHIWSRDTGKGFPEAREIGWAVRQALHEVDLVLEGPFALSEIRHRDTQFRRDPDGCTIHGIVNFEATIEA